MYPTQSPQQPQVGDLNTRTSMRFESAEVHAPNKTAAIVISMKIRGISFLSKSGTFPYLFVKVLCINKYPQEN
jgi:hypothetical protein